jgi:hypothetical protein
MRLSPIAVAAATVLSLALMRPRPVMAGPGDLLIPFAADVDLDPLAQYVASFLDTSQCERFAVFINGSVTGQTNPSNLKVSLRIGVPDGETIVRAGTMTPTGAGSISDDAGVTFLWQQHFEMIAPRIQPIIVNSHPSAQAHVNKAWFYCKTARRR